jgi:uncharacterized protein YdeI (YjbR/CyaY-like superfamily)
MKAAESFDPRVDAYINKSAAFAQPVLEHVRELVHKAVPDVEEAIKWSMPFFAYKGQNLGGMAAFKQHCSFGLWGREIREVMKKDGIAPDEVMLSYIKQAAAFIDDGVKTMSRPKKAARPAPETPPELAAALKKNKAAQKVWNDFSPSCQREYTEWITEAKREETKQNRIIQAVEQIAEGKQRNWKYQSC